MEKWYAIKVFNKTQRTIMITAGYEKESMNPYPDTSLPISRPHLQEVKSNEYGEIISSFKWEEEIDNLPSDTLSIYLFDADTVNICGWEEIAMDYKVLKRYDLSVDDLIKTNWTVTYP
jgi:hypothetical protein